MICCEIVLCVVLTIRLFRKLLSERALTLEKAVSLAIAMEAALKDFGGLQRGSGTAMEKVNYVAKTKNINSPMQQDNSEKYKSPSKSVGTCVTPTCWRCDGAPSTSTWSYTYERNMPMLGNGKLNTTLQRYQLIKTKSIFALALAYSL